MKMLVYSSLVNRLDKDFQGSPAKFGFQWTEYPEILKDYEEQFLGWISALDLNSVKGKSIVDAGCGTGRNSFWLRKYNGGKILAFDVEPSTVEVAQKNLKELTDCFVERASIYQLDSLKKQYGSFDFIFSIGVIHHLADPVGALESLKTLSKPSTQLVIWVYGKEGNAFLLPILRPLRIITSRIPIEVVHFLAATLSLILLSALKLFRPKNSYFRLATGWTRRHLTTVIFDQLFPKIANYWSRNEIIQIVQNAGWRVDAICPVNNMSWSLVASIPSDAH
jgi:SAM-dependent methyltransferase